MPESNKLLEAVKSDNLEQVKKILGDVDTSQFHFKLQFPEKSGEISNEVKQMPPKKKSQESSQTKNKEMALINLKDESGKTPLHYAVQNNNIEIAELLIENGARVNVGDINNDYPLHYAVNAGNEEIVKLLLENYAKFNAQNVENKTPLHIALEQKKYNIAKLLIEQSPTILEDHNGLTQLDYAVRADNKEIIDEFKNHGYTFKDSDQNVKTSPDTATKEVVNAIPEQPVVSSDNKDQTKKRTKRNKFLQMILRNKLFISISGFVSGGAAAGVSLGLYDKIKELLGIKKLKTWVGKILTSIGTFFGVFAILTLCRAIFKKFKTSGNSTPPAASNHANCQHVPAPGASSGDEGKNDNPPGPGKTN